MTRRLHGLAAAALILALAVDARAGGFLDDVETGRAEVKTRTAQTQPDAAARATAARDAVAAHTPASVGFTIGATLAALDADMARGPGRRSAAERTLVEQQVRELLAAQAEAGIGNRALCLLSGRPERKSLERQIRLVEPRWSCDRR